MKSYVWWIDKGFFLIISEFNSLDYRLKFVFLFDYRSCSRFLNYCLMTKEIYSFQHYYDWFALFPLQKTSFKSRRLFTNPKIIHLIKKSSSWLSRISSTTSFYMFTSFQMRHLRSFISKNHFFFFISFIILFYSNSLVIIIQMKFLSSPIDVLLLYIISQNIIIIIKDWEY